MTTEENESPQLRLAVFDLDFTIWQPEMYEIFGPPKLKKKQSKYSQKNSKSNNQHQHHHVGNGKDEEKEAQDTTIPIVVDQYNTQITVFEGAAYALAEINRLRENHGMDIQVAVASRTDEPEWAYQCMDWLTANDGKTLTACFDHVEIGFDDKKWHFQRLKKATGIEYDSMVFFDNEMRNITSVQDLGVKCIYTPHGMTREAWLQAMHMFGISE